MRLIEIFVNPSRKGFKRGKKPAIYVVPIEWDGDQCGFLVCPVTDGEPSQEALATFADRLDKEVSTDGCMMPRLYQMHVIYKEQFPAGLVFPITNGREWLTVDVALDAIVRAASCPNNRCC